MTALLWSKIRPSARRFRNLLGHSSLLEPRLQRIDRHRRIKSLGRSILFDREYYELQAQCRFRTRRAALAHFLDTGLELGLSISPFYQEAWYQYHTDPDSGSRFLSFFFGAEGLNTTAPFFDARVYAKTLAAQGLAAPSTSREALEGFLSGAAPTTLLPVHEASSGRPTVGEARATALQCAQEINRQEHVTRPRLSTEWTPLTPPVGAHSSPATVTVIMPVRNRATVVAVAIRSVLAQTCPNWNLIVVDDGSDDRTVEVVEEFAARDPRITLICQTSKGVCAARNAGLYAADGDYVAFLDSDNAWVPEFLEWTLAALEGTSAIGSHAAVKLVDENGHSQFLAFGGDRDDLVQGGNFIDLNTLVTRRPAVLAVDGFDENLRRWVDYDLVIRLFAIGEFLFLPFVGVIYNHRNDLDRISTTESPGWEQVVLTKYLLDWDEISATASSRSGDLVSIVMLTYADWRFTLDAVRSILDNSGSVLFEVIVVDNGSPRPVREILSAGLAGEPRVRHLPLSRNTNFSLGSNIGFSATHGSLVVFLNDDVSVHPDWLAPLVDAMATRPDVGAAQPLILGPSGEIQSAGFELLPPDYLPRDRITTPSPQPPLAAVSAVAAIFRAVDFANRQGFDPIYANGLEDADLALRMSLERPWKFVVVEQSLVTHFAVFSPGRFAATAANSRVFTQRWHTALEQRTRSGRTN